MPAFRFCPACANRLPDVAPGAHPRCGFCGATWWRNSKPCVAAIVLREGQVLLSRRADAPKMGEWDLPGGFLEWGEEPLVGLIREVDEETGLRLSMALLLDAVAGEYGEDRTANLVYLCEADGEPRAGSDSVELKWFPLDGLPPLAWPHEKRAIETLARAAEK